MSKEGVLLEFTKNFAGKKKGYKQVFSRDNAAILIKDKIAKKVNKTSKPKK